MTTGSHAIGKYHKRTWLFCLSMTFLALALSGCGEPKVIVPPTLTLNQVLNNYNTGVSSIVPFYASLGRWRGELGTGSNKEKHSDSGGKLFYRPATEDGGLPKLYMQFDSPLKSKLLVLVSDETYYGLYSETDKGGGSWGYHANVGKDCSKLMPVDISALLESLALKTISPEKVQSFKVTEYYNIVEYVNPAENLFYLHEIAFDRFTSLPREIKIYSRDGKLVSESRLSKYRILTLPDKQVVNLPGEIVLNYYNEEARLEIRLDKYKPDTANRDLLFQVALDKARQYRQVDADCEDTPAAN